MAVPYFVVVPFTHDPEGMLVAGEAREAPNGELARRRAQALLTSPGVVGTIAFSRTGDPVSGDFADAAVIAVFGTVDVNALSE